MMLDTFKRFVKRFVPKEQFDPNNKAHVKNVRKELDSLPAKQRLRATLLWAAFKAGYGDCDIDEPVITGQNNPKHGDYSSNIAFKIAKQTGEDPSKVAKKIRKFI